MEFLQQLFGNLTSGIIRLGVAVGILAAVGIFIVKPILDTTNHAVDSSNKIFEKSFESSNIDTKAIEEKINKSIEEVNGQVQVQVEHSFHTAKIHGGDKRTEKLLHCIQRANGNVHRIERCSKRY
jgi:predicted PurR-regulated permease PerM